MLTDFLKFTHVLIAISVLALTLYCFALISSKQFISEHLKQCYKINKIILGLLLTAMLLGTLLVHPKHYTFTTPWIEAAYALVGIVLIGLVVILRLIKQNTFVKQRFWQVIYLILIVIFACIIRDAVAKTSFFL